MHLDWFLRAGARPTSSKQTIGRKEDKKLGGAALNYGADVSYSCLPSSSQRSAD